MADTTVYPTGIYPAAFYFSLVVGGQSSAGSGSTAVDAAFREISGLEYKVDIEEVSEGGENRFVYRLPGRVTYPSLVMKRGFVTEHSFLSTWFAETVATNYVNPIEPQTLKLSLLDSEGQPKACWTIENAYPVSWKLSDLHAMKNEISVETMELAYNYFTRTS